jgi:hypothetical protein
MSDQNQSDLTDQTLPDAAHVDAADGVAAAEQSLSLAELEATLGKKFPNKEVALKAVKDTFNYVGSKSAAADPAPAVPNDVMEKLSSLEQEVFYANHPEYKGHEAIIKAMGSNPAEVVGGEAFKTYFEKAKVADEVAQTKSVVASNARVAQTKSQIDTAVTAANAGQTDAMLGALTEAIREQYEL